MEDPIKYNTQPSYYGGKDNPLEVIKFIQAHNLGFCLGNVVEYVFRADKKDKEKELEDLLKAQEYLSREIELLMNAKEYVVASENCSRCCGTGKYSKSINCDRCVGSGKAPAPTW